VLGLTLSSSLTCASEYCTKEQYEHDHAFIESAITAGTLARGPKGLRESILMHEGFWFDMNYPEQIAFMQRFECAEAGTSGKHLLYMDVRSLATGKLLATWTLDVLKPAQGVTPGMSEGNPGMSEGMDGENRIGLVGEARANFIKYAMDVCNKSGKALPTYCSCYANALADSVSIKELREPALENREEAIIALRPKIDAAAKRCLTN
jgi:hypothetical protein